MFPLGLSLTRLHDVVQVAMGWEGYHLRRFGMLAFGDVRGKHDPTTALDVVLRQPGDRVGYVYDCGGPWGYEETLKALRGVQGLALPAGP